MAKRSQVLHFFTAFHLLCINVSKKHLNCGKWRDTFSTWLQVVCPALLQVALTSEKAQPSHANILKTQGRQKGHSEAVIPSKSAGLSVFCQVLWNICDAREEHPQLSSQAAINMEKIWENISGSLIPLNKLCTVPMGTKESKQLSYKPEFANSHACLLGLPQIH